MTEPIAGLFDVRRYIMSAQHHGPRLHQVLSRTRWLYRFVSSTRVSEPLAVATLLDIHRMFLRAGEQKRPLSSSQSPTGIGPMTCFDVATD